MPVLQALYLSNPAAVWLAAAALLVALELATGAARIAPAALAALAPAALALAKVGPGLPLEIGMFVVLSAALSVLVGMDPARMTAIRAPAHGLPTPRRAMRKTTLAARPATRPALLNLGGDEAAWSAPAPVAAPTAEAFLALRREAVASVKAVPPAEPPKRRAPPPTVASPADPTRAKRLVGATGRTAGEFANGVGRVWLDGSEWGAELDHGEALEPDQPVEVVSVSGGVRLMVRPVAFAA